MDPDLSSQISSIQTGGDYTLEYELRNMNVPPEGINDWQRLCACQKRKLGRAVTFAQIQNSAKNACRLCRAFEQVILALISGKLPDLFQGPKDEAEHIDILNSLVVRPDWRYLDLLVQGKTLDVRLFVDAEEHSHFTLQGYSFPAMHPFEPVTSSERGF